MNALLLTLLLGLRPTLSGPEALRDTARFRVHFTLAGDDAPPHGAADADTVASGIEEVSRRWIDQLGMRAPLSDGGTADDGGDGRIDVYLRRLASARGLTHPVEVGHAPATSAFIELDPRTALISPTRLAAAAGHEAHHAIEYAYSPSLAPWIYEATAAYVEHADFTDPALQAETDAHFAALLDHPETPLDRADGVHEYDELVFVKFLIDRRPDRDAAHLGALWEAMVREGDAIGGLTDAEGASPQALLAAFALFNLHACAADDGMHYDPSIAGCHSSDRAAPPGVGVVPATVALPLAALAIAWRSIPLDACHPVRAAVTGGSDVLLVLDGADSPALPGAFVLDGDGPSSTLVAASGSAPDLDLAVALAAAASPCSQGGGAASAGPRGSGTGSGCAIGPSHRNAANASAAANGRGIGLVLVSALVSALVLVLSFARLRRRAGASGGVRSPADPSPPSPA